MHNLLLPDKSTLVCIYVIFLRDIQIFLLFSSFIYFTLLLHVEKFQFRNRKLLQHAFSTFFHLQNAKKIACYTIFFFFESYFKWHIYLDFFNKRMSNTEYLCESGYSSYIFTKEFVFSKKSLRHMLLFPS